MSRTQTDVSEFINELNAGVFANQIGAALSKVALGVVEHGKQGKVTLTFDLKRISDSSQVAIKHKLVYAAPTKRGSQSEDLTTETPMHVNAGGRLTLFAENHGQLFTRDQAPVTPTDA